ncbi:MAG: topoisomerase C-terminal repeat-containing protein [Clostridia bacterium]|nr:topoisomerase C-terminal repeat-containing protein [Clostridia bacterium]
MILIIAEKPSLGRNIAAGIGQMNKHDGYLEGNGYIITWAFGHLFSLCDVEAYDKTPGGNRTEKNWTMDNLPCFPEKFLFELRKGDKGEEDKGVIRQFQIIKSLCLRNDVTEIVNAGDADREGEIIIRLCIENALRGEKAADKPRRRLWLPDQTPQTVRAALADLKDEKEYDLLASEGFARTYIDWLYGINLTRYATLRTGVLLRVGRVIAPIVRAIYERDLAIRNFVPGKYLAILSKEKTHGEVVELLSKNRFETQEIQKAADLCRKYNEAGAVVTSVKNKKETLSPGKLYSLSKLQNVLGKKFKMPMNESLEIVQRLYEQGYLTYPRTNSEYMATAEKGKVQQILEAVKKLGYPVAMRHDKGVFDDSKIESHSALTPTYKIPDPKKLSEKEKQVYSTVFRRFIAVFCAEKCMVSRTEIEIAVGDLETFTLKGTVILEPGWTKYDDRPVKDKTLPDLKKGESVNIDFKPTEKETAPPKHYTIETLNNYLKNPFKEEKAAAKEQTEDESEDDTEDYKAIFEGLELGTEATRTGIIENAIKSRYISLKKDTYYILPDGEFFIESLDRMQISMDKYKTSELGVSLKKVFHGKSTVEESVELAKEQISAVFEKGKSLPDIGERDMIVGVCPVCGGDVRRKGRYYLCEKYKPKEEKEKPKKPTKKKEAAKKAPSDGSCPFIFGTVICGRVISAEEAKKLLEQKNTGVLYGFYSKKTGKTFSGALKIDESGSVVFDFEDDKKTARSQKPTREKGPAAAQSAENARAPKTAPALLCPLCGKKILKGKTAYGCAGYREGCAFRIPFHDGTPQTPKELEKEIAGYKK